MIEKDVKELEEAGISTDDPQIQFYLYYRAYGDYYTRYRWLKGDLKASPEDMARQHTKTRYALFEMLDGRAGNN